MSRNSENPPNLEDLGEPMDIANVRGSNEDELDNELEAGEDLPPI